MCRSKHTLSSKGHLLNKFDVPVEVRDLGGNFDTLGKKIFFGTLECQNRNFYFAIPKSLILDTRLIFWRVGYLKKIMRKKMFYAKIMSKLGPLTVLQTHNFTPQATFSVFLLVLMCIFYLLAAIFPFYSTVFLLFLSCFVLLSLVDIS